MSMPLFVEFTQSGIINSCNQQDNAQLVNEKINFQTALITSKSCKEQYDWLLLQTLQYKLITNDSDNMIDRLFSRFVKSQMKSPAITVIYIPMISCKFFIRFLHSHYGNFSVCNR